jgi:glycosyltransferase involved in cell wall biosynthesis
LNTTATACLPEISIIVPVYNGAGTLRACLEALLSAPGPARELIVVDDGSRDDSAAIAASLGVRTIRHPRNLGCDVARNSGTSNTQAPILVFVDADVVIEPSALQRIATFMADNPNYSAVFGSYDGEPSDRGFVSQYRNLLHYFTHQNGKCEAETFWTGLGAVRRSVFHSVGGFRFGCRSIGDIALGLDLSDAGFRIRLDHGLLGKHLKAWTLRTMVATDVFLRALPWSEIILARGGFTNDLNTSATNRLAVAFANITVACAAVAVLVPAFAALAGLSFFAMLLANTHVFKQFWKERGLFFTLGVVPLHFVHQLCSGVGFALGLKRHYLGATSPLHFGLPSRFNVGSEGTALDEPAWHAVRHSPIIAAAGDIPKVQVAYSRAS